ncbi:MAG: right-handed parallel beta-helix repeat-containing protein [Verrucomicrobiota bacterium]
MLAPAVVAADGHGMLLELVNRTDQPAMLSAIEILAANPNPTSNVKASLKLSTDDGANWTPAAADLPMDVAGNGEFLWTPGQNLAGQTALLRVRVAVGALFLDSSNAPFLIVNGGRDYYVNDAAFLSNDWTTAAGNNANGGKDPAHPVASLFALFTAYDLEPTDVIHVDAGRYAVPRNLVLGSEDSGVRIEGYHDAQFQERFSLLERGNTVEGSYLFELQDASNVTLDWLRLTGAETGIGVGDDSVSHGLTVRNSTIFGNQADGIYLGYEATGAVIANNSIFGVKGGPTNDDQVHGIVTHAANVQLNANTVFDHRNQGIGVMGPNSVVQNNEVYGNSAGILAEGPPEGVIQVLRNRVHENALAGIQASFKVLVSGNEIFGHLAFNGTGLELGHGAVAAENRVYRNTTGISAGGTQGDDSRVERNRVYANQTSGIILRFSTIADGNKVYSNGVGIESEGRFIGKIINNIVYSNTEQGILVRGGTAEWPVTILNNTVVQSTGDAMRLESEAEKVRLQNNILTIESGYALHVTSNEAGVLESDYNLFRKSTAANAHLVSSGGTNMDTLNQWQAAAQSDVHSLVADPLFVDPDGADNVLGFRAANGGYDGGVDDNFVLNAGSPAIDRADSWAAPTHDALSAARRDDPGTPNLGAADYAIREQAQSSFAAVGQAQNWHSDSGLKGIALPFVFPFYGQGYSEIFVSSRGWIDFELGGNDGRANSTSELAARRRIAPLWADVRTGAAGDDLYVATGVPGQITVRWDAASQADNGPAAFAVTLFSDGRMRFDYGSGNANLSPTVGFSSGDGEHYLVASYSGRPSLANANSLDILLTPDAGLADIGAYEFGGSSLDHTPPLLVSTVPSAIHSSGVAGANLRQITLSFSEALNPIDANAPTNYELRRDGGDGVFGNADDTIYELQPDYLPGATEVVLRFVEEELLPGRYRLQISGDSSLHDLAGNRLDGDGNGAAGGNYLRIFQVTASVPTVRDLRVNDGTAQRSRVTSVAVTFDLDVSASLTIDDFELTNRTTGNRVQLSSGALAYDRAAQPGQVVLCQPAGWKAGSRPVPTCVGGTRRLQRPRDSLGRRFHRRILGAGRGHEQRPHDERPGSLPRLAELAEACRGPQSE